MTQAVPLSRQLVEQAAADGCDLGTAEGRAHMVAKARPLWSALPDGALKRQLLAELARRAQLEVADLAALWGGAAAPVAPGGGGRRQPALQAPIAPPAPDPAGGRAAQPPRPQRPPTSPCACCCATATGGNA